jgi:flagellar assembly protein FliH
MGLIKASTEPAGVIHFECRDIEAQARAKLNQAQAQAEAMLDDAQSRSLSIEEDARAAGQARGMAAGREEGRAEGRAQVLQDYADELKLAAQTFLRAAKEIEASREVLQSEALGEVVQLAIAIAQRVTKRQGLIDPQVLRANLRDAMKMVVRGSAVRIAVHPTQRAALVDALPQLKIDWPTMEHVAVVDDESISPGGCRVSTNHGQIDADLQSQLDRIAAELSPPRSEGT